MPAPSGASQHDVHIGIEGGVATLSLNRPQSLNRWTKRMSEQFSAALANLDADPTVRAVVITGKGTSFCAGVDLRDPDLAFDAESRPEPSVLPFDVNKPVAVAIHGHAIGVGITLALCADVRFVAVDASISFVFTRLGLVAELGSHYLLPRVVGHSAAADLLLSGRKVDGVEAAGMGLASRCVKASEVLAVAQAWAKDVALNVDPEAAAYSKRLLWSFVPSFAAVREQEVVLLSDLASRAEVAARIATATR